MERVLTFKKGTIFNFTAGEYSDYQNVACMVALQDCDLADLAQEFAGAFVYEPEKPWNKCADPTDFPSWLVSKGYLEPMDSTEVHLGSYGEWEPEFGIEPAGNDFEEESDEPQCLSDI